MAAPRVRESELRTKHGFVAALAALKAASPYSYAKLGKLIDAPTSTVHGWCRGQHLPYARETDRFVQLLVTLGVRDTEPWVIALNRLRTGDEHDTPTNPYPGLAPYTEAEAHLYTRVDGALTELLASVDERSQRFQPPPIIVLGPSGSGKTSLLRAGLLPALHARGVVTQRLTAGPTLADDLATLAAALADDEGPTGSHVVVLDQFEVALSTDLPRSVLDHLATLRAHQHVVIVAARSDFFERLAAHPVLRDGLADGPIIVTTPHGAQIADLVVRPAERAGLDVDPELVAELTRTFDDDPTTGHVALPLLSHVLHQLAQTPERNTLTLDAYHRLGGIQHALAHAADDAWNTLNGPQRAACEALFLQLVQLGEQAHPTRRHLDLDDLDELADPFGYDTDHHADLRGADDAGTETATTTAHTTTGATTTSTAASSTTGATTASTAASSITRATTAGTAATTSATTTGTTTSADTTGTFTRRDMETVIDAFLRQRLLTIDQSRLTISHERLVTAWPRLEDWITTERAALLTSRRLAIAAVVWAESDLDDDLLLNGVLLDEAIALRDQQRLLLDPLARNFLARSEERRRRDQERHAQLVSRQLAMQSVLVPEPSVGAQLAVLAWQTAPTTEARSALLSSARRGAHTRILGEPGFVTLALAPDRRRAVTNHGPGHALELLAPHDGAWCRRGTIDTGVDEPIGFAWSPSGRHLVVAADDGALAVVTFRGAASDDTGSDDTARTGTDDSPGTGVTHRVLVAPGGARTTAITWVDDHRFLVGGSDLTLWTGDPTGDEWSPAAVATLDAPASSLCSIAVPGPTHRTSPDPAPDPARHTTHHTTHHTTLVAAATTNGAIRFFLVDDATGSLTPAWSHVPDDAVAASCVAFSPDGHLLAAGWYSGDVKVWRCFDDGAVEQCLGGEPLFGTWVNDVSFSPDGHFLAAASSDGTVLIWSTDTWDVIEGSELRHPSVVTSVDFVAEGLLTACEDGAVRLWGAAGGVEDPGSLWSAPIDRSGRVLTGSRNAVTRRPVGSIDPVDAADPVAATTAPVERWRAADLGVEALSGITVATADGAAWAVGGRVGDVLWYDEFRIRRLFTGTDALVETLDLARDDRLLLVGDRSGTVTSWFTDRLDDGPVSSVLLDPPVISLSIDPTGRSAVVASESGRAHLLDIDAGGTLTELSAWTAGSSFSIAAAFHPTERLVAIGNADASVSIWSVADVRAPVLVSRMKEPAGHVFGVAFSHDGTRIAGASTDGRVWVWDVTDPAEPELWAGLESDSRGMYAVTFTDDDQAVIGVGARSAIRRWRLDTDRVAAEVLARAGDPMTPAEWERYVPPGIERA